jgi:hypothetical protein
MVALFSKQPMQYQTAFSELKRQAFEQPFLLVGTPGSLGTRVVSGKRFYYRQYYDANGKKAAQYIGSVEDRAAIARAHQVEQQIALTNTLLKDAQRLAREGYVRADSRTGAVLAALANHGIFRGGAVLVGSHAFGAVLNELGLRAPAFTTEDVDIARPAPLKIALAEPDGIGKVLADSGLQLLPVPQFDHNKPSTSYKPPGADRFRVDLLVPTAGQDIKVLEVPELKAHATALPFLGYLLAEPIEAIVMGHEAIVPVRAPSPERFAWHKALVSQLRTRSSEKREKDLRQSAVLLTSLAETTPSALEDAFEALPRGSREQVRSAVRAVLSTLESTQHEAAREFLRKFAKRSA